MQGFIWQIEPHALFITGNPILAFVQLSSQLSRAFFPLSVTTFEEQRGQVAQAATREGRFYLYRLIELSGKSGYSNRDSDSHASCQPVI